MYLTPYVRRTRPFVKRFYPADTVEIDGRRVPITFPTPRVRKVVYDFDTRLPGFFDRFAAALDVDDGSPPDPAAHPEVLTLARYAPSRYGPSGPVARELQLSGLLRSALLKRFESSPYAFARTCERMAESHDAFVAILEQGKIATGEALREWSATDTDDPDELDEYMADNFADLEPAGGYDVGSLRAHVEHDRDLLRTFAAEGRALLTSARRPGLDAIVEALAEIAAQAAVEAIDDDDARDKRKVLIFTYYTDTVEWIEEHLLDIVERDPRLHAYRGRITSVSGGWGEQVRGAVGLRPGHNRLARW